MPGHTLDCELFLFCWKTREAKRKDERKEKATQVQAIVGVFTSVICETERHARTMW